MAIVLYLYHFLFSTNIFKHRYKRYKLGLSFAKLILTFSLSSVHFEFIFALLH